MAKQIIILERDVERPITLRFVMWATVPAARQSFFANASAASAFKNATAAEVTAIQNGSIAERVDTLRLPQGSTLAQIQAALITAFNKFQADVTGGNQWDRYGTSWDGTTWTAGGVA